MVPSISKLFTRQGFRASLRLPLPLQGAQSLPLAHPDGSPAPCAVRPAGWQPDFIPFPTNLTWSQVPEVRAWASLGGHGFVHHGLHLSPALESTWSYPRKTCSVTPLALAHPIGPLSRFRCDSASEGAARSGQLSLQGPSLRPGTWPGTGHENGAQSLCTFVVHMLDVTDVIFDSTAFVCVSSGHDRVLYLDIKLISDAAVE